MSNQVVTEAIVLSRRDYSEADRIITAITPGHGKLGVLAKGVRRPKSKLAGGIELFSVNEFTLIEGRGQLYTLTSSRVKTHYSHIVKSIDRTMLGYELIKQLHKITEDELEPEYYYLCRSLLTGLDDVGLDLRLLEAWFWCRLLYVGGYMPDLRSDVEGQPLLATENYLFNYDHMAFEQSPAGSFNSRHIKLLRLTVATTEPEKLTQLNGATDLLDATLKLLQSIAKTQIY